MARPLPEGPVSELEPQSRLELPISGLRGNFAELCCVIDVEIGSHRHIRGIQRLRMVQYIGRVHSEFQAFTLSDLERLAHRRVQGP